MPPVCPETEAEQHRRAPSTSVTLLTRTCEPQGTRGSLKLLSTAFTLPREALAWGKSLWHSQGMLLVKGEGIPAILGFLEPPSPLLSSVAEQPEHSSRSLGLCQGISSSSRLTLAQSLWRRWESFPKCLPRSLSLLAARLSLARPRSSSRRGWRGGKADGALQEKAARRRKITTRNTEKGMKCYRKVGLREIRQLKITRPRLRWEREENCRS